LRKSGYTLAAVKLSRHRESPTIWKTEVGGSSCVRGCLSRPDWEQVVKRIPNYLTPFLILLSLRPAQPRPTRPRRRRHHRK
jgi:hypothetical protein